jgi:hypothetical protein
MKFRGAKLLALFFSVVTASSKSHVFGNLTPPQWTSWVLKPARLMSMAVFEELVELPKACARESGKTAPPPKPPPRNSHGHF